MYVFKEAVNAGGLMSYGAYIPDLIRRADARDAHYYADVMEKMEDVVYKRRYWLRDRSSQTHCSW
jgi:hypothetical protein